MDKNNIENFKKATNKSLGAVHTHGGNLPNKRESRIM